MVRKRKTWVQKWAEATAKPGLPKVFDCASAGQRMVVPAPAEIEAFVRQVPAGQVVTMADLGKHLAARHGADLCCPMTAGIFVWLLAYATCESLGLDVDCGRRAESPPPSRPGAVGSEIARAAKRLAHTEVPWWRVVKAKGELNPKLPLGPALQRVLLEAEGHTVDTKGKKQFVAGLR